MSSAFIYILTNDRHNVLYTGCTSDLRKRIYHHKHRPVPGFTKKCNVHKLVYFEAQLDMSAARIRERQIKSLSRKKKDALIDVMNCNRRELYGEL